MTQEQVYNVIIRVVHNLSRCNDFRLTNLNLIIQTELLNEPNNVRIIVNKLFQVTRPNLVLAKHIGIEVLINYLSTYWCPEMLNGNLKFDHSAFQKLFEEQEQTQIKQGELFIEEWNHFVQTFGEVTEENLDHAYDYIEITYESDYVKHAIRQHLYKNEF
jgi:hypothetical protein